MKIAIMMMENVAAHLQIKDFVLIANVKVRTLLHRSSKKFIYSDTFFNQFLEFTCSIDADCNNGYCENEKCTCLDDYQLKEDCSLKGCEYDFWS